MTSPAQPRDTGFWLTDRDLRARLHQAVEGLVTTTAYAVEDDVNIIDALKSFAVSECQEAGVDAAFAVLVQAHAAHVIANWTIDRNCVGPLDLGLLFSLDDFHDLPEKIQSALLHEYTADTSQWEDFHHGNDSNLYLSRYEALDG
ncbi:hypothetical protein ABTX81_01900 [Kitasatospora sp. NPDC097605]|uniref:hypothetical protein n=1 Tax=Kitasatospora sp. NPDC097605 TaxID=3157226 RepID=UPI00332FABC9